ncbi:MAG: hypothetical protein Q7K54_04765, partial [Candidatus Parcubacteria bacterium]|nr:hypothetical protein [Candidatus Parcubacteria bacterium]
MPTIRIDYDDEKLEDKEVLLLSGAVQKIVSSITGIEDTFVYAGSPHIKIKVAPIEVFVQISAIKVPDRDSLFNNIKNQLSDWKKSNNFNYPINLTLMPMDWKFE